MFDGIRQEARPFKTFYLPKLVLLGLIWVAGIVVYTWSQYQQLGNAAYNVASDPSFIFFQVVMLVLIIIYLFWMVYALCRTCSDAKTLPYLGIRIKFFGFFTFLVILTVIGGLIFGGVVGSYNNAAEFLSYLALFNLYCYTLAFVYSPAKGVAALSATPNKAERIGMVRLEDEDDPQQHASIGNLDFGSAPSGEENSPDFHSLHGSGGMIPLQNTL